MPRKDHRTYMLLHSNHPVEFRQTVKDICCEIIDQMNRIMQLAVNIGLGVMQRKRKIFMFPMKKRKRRWSIIISWAETM